MSTTTTNYNLVKPEGSEYPDISIINGNMDIIDAALTDATPSKITLNQSEIDRDGPNPSSMQTGDSYIVARDKDGERIGLLVPLRGATGGSAMTLYAYNETSNGDEVSNYLSVFAMKDGSKAFALGDPTAFRKAANCSRAWYASCSTAEATSAKSVYCSGFVLEAGTMVCVRFTYSNTAASATLNVNSTGAKAIYANTSSVAADVTWMAGETVPFVYDGTYWRMVGSVGVNKVLANSAASLASSYFSGNTYIYKCGKLVMLKFNGLKGLASNGTTTLCSIPAAYRPYSNVTFDRLSITSKAFRFSVYEEGSFQVYAYGNTGDSNFCDTLVWATS